MEMIESRELLRAWLERLKVVNYAVSVLCCVVLCCGCALVLSITCR